MRQVLTILVLCGWAVWPSQAGAQFMVREHTVQALMWCESEVTYAPGDPGAPDAVARSFAGRGAVVTFRVCQDVDGNTHYFLRKPRPNRNGICRVVEDEIFPGSKEDFVIVDVLYGGTDDGWYFDLPGWTSQPPRKWREMNYSARHRELGFAIMDASACPRTDDARYITMTGTDGMLKSFFRIWRTATASPGSFDSVFSSVPILPDPMFPKSGFSLVREALRNTIFLHHQDIVYVDCTLSATSSESGCVAQIDTISILFDVTEHGIVITGIHDNPVT